MVKKRNWFQNKAYSLTKCLWVNHTGHKQFDILETHWPQTVWYPKILCNNFNPKSLTAVTFTNYSETNRVISWIIWETKEKLNSSLKEFIVSNLTWGCGEEKTAHKDIWMVRIPRKKQLHWGSLNCFNRFVKWGADLRRLYQEAFLKQKYTTTLLLFSLMKPIKQKLNRYRIWLWKY